MRGRPGAVMKRLLGETEFERSSEGWELDAEYCGELGSFIG